MSLRETRAQQGRLWKVVRPSSAERPASRVAVCHDWFTTLGGADKVAALLSRHYRADLVAAFAVRPELLRNVQVEGEVVASRLNSFASRGRNWQILLPLMPAFWRSLDLSQFDVVITSSHAAVNAVRAPHALRICYCHTPMRYAWAWRMERERIARPLRPLLPAAALALRHADRRWAGNVDAFVANSRAVAQRIARAYGRTAEVIHPPIDTEFWCPSDEQREDYFLVAGRLVSYKQPLVAVDAARRARVPMVVAGDGPELAEILRTAPDNVTIVRSPDDLELRDLYRRARALVLPGVEDFGMTLVEAQACGTPVIARNAGGALDAVVPGITGELVGGGSVDDFTRALANFDDRRFDTREIRRHAEGYGVGRFLDEMDELLQRCQEARSARSDSE